MASKLCNTVPQQHQPRPSTTWRAWDGNNPRPPEMQETLYRDCHTHSYCNITGLRVEWESRNMPQSLTPWRKRTPGHSLPLSISIAFGVANVSLVLDLTE
ncbi:hypothetical protein IG631_18490 [Alternaria alternata]|nr:hypothetical protein IG631_18490 [Alternaria alternata]